MMIKIFSLINPSPINLNIFLPLVKLSISYKNLISNNLNNINKFNLLKNLKKNIQFPKIKRKSYYKISEDINFYEIEKFPPICLIDISFYGCKTQLNTLSIGSKVNINPFSDYYLIIFQSQSLNLQ